MSYWSEIERHTDWEQSWMSHPAVRARINRLVTGDPLRWPIMELRTLVPDRVPFENALSIGCGVGNFERTLVELDLVKRVTGLDASARAVEAARAASALAGTVSRIDYVTADARDFLARRGAFDAVFFHQSLHHFVALPDLLGLVRRALLPRGILYLEEYVGPSRTEWSWRHLLRWNAVYWGLPRGVRRARVVRSPVNRDDPTEAVESSGILRAIDSHFRVLARRDYGGNLIAVIYPNLLRPSQPGGPSPAAFGEVIQALLAREDAVLRREPGFHTVIAAEPRPIS